MYIYLAFKNNQTCPKTKGTRCLKRDWNLENYPIFTKECAMPFIIIIIILIFRVIVQQLVCVQWVYSNLSWQLDICIVKCKTRLMGDGTEDGMVSWLCANFLADGFTGTSSTIRFVFPFGITSTFQNALKKLLYIESTWRIDHANE